MKKALLFALTLIIATPHAHAADMKKIATSSLKCVWNMAKISSGVVSCGCGTLGLFRNLAGGKLDDSQIQSVRITALCVLTAGGTTAWSGTKGLYQEVTGWFKTESDTQEDALELSDPSTELRINSASAETEESMEEII